MVILAFHPSDESRYDFVPVFDTFIFEINSITDLYKEGNKIKANKNETITKYVNYSNSEIELELINFNQDPNICAKSNSSLGFINNGNNDFIYNICFWGREGELKELDPKIIFHLHSHVGAFFGLF